MPGLHIFDDQSILRSPLVILPAGAEQILFTSSKAYDHGD